MLYLDRLFLPAYQAIDPAAAYEGDYDGVLVGVSVAIAIISAFVALSIAGRVSAAERRRSRLAWTSAGAVSLGGGIWSMHFVGMLAFSLPCGVSYDPVRTLLSMVPGVLASGVAIYVLGAPTRPRLGRLLVAAVLMGAGIGAMHYVGMASVESDILLLYDPATAALSVFVAVLLAFIALAIRFSDPGRLGATGATVVAASVMGSAIAGMHYTAMQAAVFFPLAGVAPSGATLPPTILALVVTIFSVLLATITWMAGFAGRQTELALRLTVEVAQREAHERDARNGRARLQAVLDAVADAIVTIDRFGRIQQWSTGAQRIFGYTAAEVIGRNLTSLMPEPHRSMHHRYVEGFLATGEAKIIGLGRELTAVRKDGTVFPIELAVSQVDTQGEVLFTGILRDITERKRVEHELVRAREQAEAANEAKSQFLATMSHEIRTPMNGVIGMATLLSSTALSDRQRHLVQNVLRSGQALLTIINDILDLSKIEAGRFDLHEVEFDVREVVADVTDLFCERCSSKGLEFVYFIGEAVPPKMTGDPVRLRQVLVNLVGNALKFTERGEILVELSVAERTAEHVVLAFSVEDTGIGIPADKRDRVFDSFTQVDASMSRARGGTGLGLTISKQLVELMGGTIGCQSEHGRGSRFHFTVRCGTVAADEEHDARSIERPLRTLLVDANAVSAHVMSLYLSTWGIDADIVATTGEAMEAWNAALDAGSAFDVAIVDVKGLGVAGMDLARTLRADTRGQPCEVILLIGMDGSIAEASIDALGPYATLTKPVRPSVLFDCLASLASGSSERGVRSFFIRRDERTHRPTFDARILVAEDNPINRDVATGILENMGCTVVTAPHGGAAVRLFAEEAFDLIFMDCEMPEVDGFEATRQIREMESLGQAAPGADAAPRRMPIVALTAHALADIRAKCLAVGMDDFLVKPFDERQIGETLGRWLDAARCGMAETGDTVVVDEPAAAPPAPPADEAPAIDRSVIEGARAFTGKNGPALLRRVVTQFATLAPTTGAAMRDAAAAGDGDALWRAAHGLKSSAAALGALHLSECCAEIERVARQDGVAPAAVLLPVFDTAADAAVAALNDMIEAPRAAA